MMHSFRTLSLIAIASLAVAKFAPSQEAEISERNPVGQIHLIKDIAQS
jgi:hypothetical protein